MIPFDEKQRKRKLEELRNIVHPGDDLGPYKDDFVKLNTINLNQDDVIYRFYNFNDFLRTINNNKLCLVRPQLWQDPFENFALNAIAQFRDGTKATLTNIKNNYYAQCWTLEEECDGLWRNYKNPLAIKVKSSVQKLMNQFYDITNIIFHDLSYFIGKVEYIPENEFLKYFDSSHSLYDQLDLVLKLLIKRPPFSNEKEVRIIFCKQSSPDTDFSKVKNKWDDTDKFFVNIDPNSLFDEVTIDPWITDDAYTDIRKIIKKLGYKGTIKKSNLYSIPSKTSNIMQIEDWI